MTDFSIDDLKPNKNGDKQVKAQIRRTLLNKRHGKPTLTPLALCVLGLDNPKNLYQIKKVLKTKADRTPTRQALYQTLHKLEYLGLVETLTIEDAQGTKLEELKKEQEKYEENLPNNIKENNIRKPRYFFITEKGEKFVHWARKNIKPSYEIPDEIQQQTT